MLNISQLESDLKPIINDQLLRFPFIMQAYIGANMVNTGLKTRIAPSTNAKIEINTGGLFRSFSRGGVGNIFKTSSTGNFYQLEYGSSLPYAAIQEYGGFIKSKGRMHKYFWAKFKETKQPYFKNLALHVQKKGGVQIPKRPYFAPAVEKFKASNQFQQEVKAKVIQGIRAWQEKQRLSNQ